MSETKKRKFVGACPAASEEFGGRRPGPLRVMVIGAHPDDPDIIAGCLSVKLISEGIRRKRNQFQNQAISQKKRQDLSILL